MKAIALNERKCRTDPIRSKRLRLLQYKASWNLIALVRLIYDKSKDNHYFPIDIENSDTNVCCNYKSPVLIDGHFVYPLKEAMLKLAEDLTGSADIIMVDYIQTSVISVYDQYLQSKGPILDTSYRYASTISRIQDSVKKQYVSFFDLRR